MKSLLRNSKYPVWCWLISAVILAGCASGPATATFHSGMEGEPTPWLHERFDADNNRFVFAVISDLYGGNRAGVFEIAIEQINLLRPEFIMSVGDLIEGASEDAAELKEEWDSFDKLASKSRAPFFHVGGNHDLTGQPLRDFWETRYGSPYYFFVYRNVLFLVLDTEDYSPERMREIYVARNEAIKVLDSSEPEKAEDMDYFKMPERVTGEIGAEQAAYFEKVIAEHPDVRWTFLFMHKPVWQREGDNAFTRIEAALDNHPYTLFNGHFHAYSYTKRNDRDYIILGTTGGGQDAKNEASFDHITLVSMGADGPSITTLKMDGILDKSGKIPAGGEDLCFQASRCEHKDN